MHSKFIFLTGSSAVGKTQIFDAFPTQISRTFKLAHPDGNKSFTDSYRVNKIHMPTREVRASLGNPKWEDLVKDRTLAHKHQDAIRARFRDIIADVAANYEPYDNIYLFERAEIDVLGYSYSYGLVNKFDNNKDLIQHSLRAESLFVYRPINSGMPYEEIEARPPGKIRVECDIFIDYQLELFGSDSNVLRSLGPNKDLAIAEIVQRVFA